MLDDIRYLPIVLGVTALGIVSGLISGFCMIRIVRWWWRKRK
jgi:hypothetical protein